MTLFRGLAQVTRWHRGPVGTGSRAGRRIGRAELLPELSELVAISGKPSLPWQLSPTRGISGARFLSQRCHVSWMGAGFQLAGVPPCSFLEPPASGDDFTSMINSSEVHVGWMLGLELFAD